MPAFLLGAVTCWCSGAPARNVRTRFSAADPFGRGGRWFALEELLASGRRAVGAGGAIVPASEREGTDADPCRGGGRVQAGEERGV